MKRWSSTAPAKRGIAGGGQEHPYYLGWSACAACHKAEVDALAGSKHMQAFATLVGKGQEHTSCAKCHTLGYNRASGYNAVLDREQRATGCGATCSARTATARANTT